MKTIWKMYGQTLFYIIVAAVLVALGIWSAGRGAERISMADTDRKQESELSALTRFYEGQEPVITYRGGSLTLGETQTLEDCFHATDEAGQALTPEIRGIWDSDGCEAEYPFQRPGIYRIEVRAQDDNRRSTTAGFWVPVNGGGI